MIRFYLVEDDKLIREGLCTCFPWDRFDIEITGSSDTAETALEEILANDVEVLLTDVVLPGMSGLDLALTLRARNWMGEIIMMSAYQDVDYVRTALKAEAVDFLFKPVQMSELTESVQRAVLRVERRRQSADYRAELWEKPLGCALENADLCAVRKALNDAAKLLTLHCETEQIKDRAADVFGFFARRVVLEKAEKNALEWHTKVQTADVEQCLVLFEQGVNALLKLLTDSQQDWRFAVEITRIIRGDFTQVDPTRIADMLHMSRSSLYRQASHVFSISLNDYLLKLRMEEACRLLEVPGVRIYEVAERVGYKDVNYFAKLFRKEIGVHPKEYHPTND